MTVKSFIGWAPGGFGDFLFGEMGIFCRGMYPLLWSGFTCKNIYFQVDKNQPK
jgi:hypothetical protein